MSSKLLTSLFRSGSFKKPLSFTSQDLWKAISSGDRALVHKILETTPNLASFVDDQGRTPLHLACEEKATTSAVILIEFGASINAADGSGWTPLHFAAYTKNEKLTMLLLLQPTINVSAVTQDGSTPLHYLARYCPAPNNDICEMLFKRGANVNTQNKNGETPLHYATFQHNLAMVQLLLKQGAEVNLPNKYVDTPLHLAVKTESKEIVACLLKAGANTAIRCGEGTAFDLCKTSSFHSFLSFIAANPESGTQIEQKILVRDRLEMTRTYELVFFEEDDDDKDENADDAFAFTTETHLTDENWADFSRQKRDSPDYVSLSKLFQWYNTLNDPGKQPLTPLLWISAALLRSPDARASFSRLVKHYCHKSCVTETSPSQRLKLTRDSSAAAEHSVKPYPWEVEFDQLQLGEVIGEGSYGSVYKAEWGGFTVAVKKQLNNRKNFSPEEMDQLLHEICIMNSLEHPNVIQFFGACLKLPNLCMIVELAEFGDLHRFLKSNFQEISWREKLIMSLDVARGMEYLYSQTPPIFHRDLKSPNLLVNGNLRVKVSDFGLSKLSNQSGGNTNVLGGNMGLGTLNWMAPEVLDDSSSFSEKSDVYSFSLIMWEFLSNQAPWERMEALQIVRALDKGDRPVIPPGSNEGFVKLMQLSWIEDPTRRPKFYDLVRKLNTLLKETLAEMDKNKMEITSSSTSTSSCPPSASAPAYGCSTSSSSSPLLHSSPPPNSTLRRTTSWRPKSFRSASVAEGDTTVAVPTRTRAGTTDIDVRKFTPPVTTSRGRAFSTAFL